MALSIVNLSAIPQSLMVRLAARMKQGEDFLKAEVAKTPLPSTELMVGLSRFYDLNAKTCQVHAGSSATGTYEFHAYQFDRIARTGSAAHIAHRPKAGHGFSGKSNNLVFSSIDFVGRQGNVCAFAVRLTAPHWSPLCFGGLEMQGLWFEKATDHVLWSVSCPKGAADPNFGATGRVIGNI